MLLICKHDQSMDYGFIPAKYMLNKSYNNEPKTDIQTHWY